MLPFTLTKLEKHSMNKYGWGREVGGGGEGGGMRGCEDAGEVHGPRKSTCMLLSLSHYSMHDRKRGN